MLNMLSFCYIPTQLNSFFSG
uniref:Uncharacterized protein n=1 Tax=Anguilla anguilla TaxID=7936 RepID=A0A0E9S1E9_ANGAN